MQNINYKKYKEKKILIASSNKGKIKELAMLFTPLNIEIISIDDFNITPPKEDGKTFIENAEIKARYYTEKTNLPCIADDSGLSIKALNGAPGIYSARWAGDSKNFNLAIDKIQKEFSRKKISSSEAFFTCALTLIWPDMSFHSFEGILDGNISFPAKGLNGFGYDPIFIPKGYDTTLAELPITIKNKISHRTQAFTQLINNCFYE
jgi:XTP/dITP diphosphohydrolase